MDIFFAFVILLNASLLIGAGYYVWKAPDYLHRFMEDAVRKQDDRLRKRFGVANNGKQESEGQASEGEPTNKTGRARRKAGAPYRR